VAGRRRLGPAAPCGVGRAGPPAGSGLVPHGPGQRQRSGEKGGQLTGPNPTDRGKFGSKYHLLVDATGLPIAALVSAANRHDSLFVAPVLDRIVGVKGPGRGRPRRRPVKLHADKGYDNRRVRRYLAGRGITARIARRGVDSSARLGRHRWVVERTMAWLLGYRRLALRYDRSEQTITALLTLACALICHRRLTQL
jgi:transposase